MGSRHNRKRIRSRPRHRRPHQTHIANDFLLDLENTPWNQPQSPYGSSPTRSISSGFDSRLPRSGTESICGQASVSWCSPGSVNVQLRDRDGLTAVAKYNVEMERARMHMYGGEEGDEIALCAPMLQVVMDLFGGNVDYEDP